ncbi:hypothetical protein [Escherichia coli]|uniref:hypothetical protein n=1 Tax=Escherichia coli TaxID=562 RepID=UPI003B97A11A
MRKIALWLFIAIFCIESGMRFAIWRALDDILWDSGEYRIDIMRYDDISFGYVGCLGHDNHNYLTIPYTLWLITDVFWARIICTFRSEHIAVHVETTIEHQGDRFYPSIDYHWSFWHWRFIDNERERQEKI